MHKNQVLLLIGFIILLLLIICALGGWILYDSTDFFITRQVECSYDGKTYEDGESFDAIDGCNTCFCEEGRIGCTEIGCQGEELPDPVPLDGEDSLKDGNDNTDANPNSQPPAVIQSLCPGWTITQFPSGDAQFLKDPNWTVNATATGTDYYHLSLQGDISVLGWPNIGVSRALNIPAADLTQLETYLQSNYSPDSLTPVTFGWGSYNGLNMRMDGCSSDDTTCNSQMWDTVEIYFFHNSHIWNISMTDVDATGAMDVYSCFVDSFELF